MLQHIPLSDGWKSWTYSNSAGTISYCERVLVSGW